MNLRHKLTGLLFGFDWLAKPQILDSRVKNPYRDQIDTPEAELIAPVSYIFPPITELNRRFSGYVNPTYDGIMFEPIKTCQNTCREARDIRFKYLEMSHDANTRAVLNEIDKQNRIPALPEELLAFDLRHPREVEEGPIAALGAITRYKGAKGVAYLQCSDVGRGLYLHWLSFGSVKGVRFLTKPKNNL